MAAGAVAPDQDRLRGFARQTALRHEQPARAAIESMNGARFVHDTLERRGWEVEVADALLEPRNSAAAHGITPPPRPR